MSSSYLPRYNTCLFRLDHRQIPNLNDLFVDIGMGIHVQFRLHEAIRWLQMKENHMDR